MDEGERGVRANLDKEHAVGPLGKGDDLRGAGGAVLARGREREHRGRGRGSARGGERGRLCAGRGARAGDERLGVHVHRARTAPAGAVCERAGKVVAPQVAHEGLHSAGSRKGAEKGGQKKKEKQTTARTQDGDGRKETPKLRQQIGAGARRRRVPRHVQQRPWRGQGWRKGGGQVRGGGRNHWRRRSTANWTLPWVCDSARRFRARSVKPMSSSCASCAA